MSEKGQKIGRLFSVCVLASTAAFVLIMAAILLYIEGGDAAYYHAAKTREQEGKLAAAGINYAKAKDFQDAAEHVLPCWELANVRSVLAAGKDCTLALRWDGAILAAGYDDEMRELIRQGTAEKPGTEQPVELRAQMDNAGVWIPQIYEEHFWSHYLDNWQDLLSISVGDSLVAGGKNDGTGYVRTWGSDRNTHYTGNLPDVDVRVGPNGVVFFLVSDGSIELGKEVDDSRWDKSMYWINIIAISGGREHFVALKSNGTVKAIGESKDGRCNVSGWTDIIAVSAGGSHTVGLRSDGTVLAVGNNDHGQCDVSDWNDIIAISAGGAHTVGLRSDGTVIAAGNNEDGRCDVGSWTDIAAIAAGDRHTAGMRQNGTVVAVGCNDNGQCDTGHWDGCAVPGTLSFASDPQE